MYVLFCYFTNRDILLLDARGKPQLPKPPRSPVT